MTEASWTPLPKLTENDDVSSFNSGAEELDDWLKSRALKGQAVGNATVFVFTHSDRVLGYYALASGGVELASAPRAVKQNAPNPIPVLLLARLAVDESAQGRGIGRMLLRDALLRSLKVSADVGFRAVLLHSRDEAARDFYLHHVPSFKPSPTEPLHLMLPLVKLREVFVAGQDDS